MANASGPHQYPKRRKKAVCYKKGRRGRLPQHNWKEIVPEVCERYIEGETITAILKPDGMPNLSAFWDHLKSNPDDQAKWEAAGHAKADFIDSDLDTIHSKAMEAVTDKTMNPNALKVALDTRIKQRGHLNPKYRDREVKHIHEAGPSMRELMTKARRRAALEPPTLEGEFVEK